MTRTITLKTNADLNELTGRHAAIAQKIVKLGGSVEVAELRKSCRTLKPKRFRAIVRQLVAAKVVAVKRVKASA